MKIGIDIRTFMDANFSGVPEYTYNLLKEIFRLDKKNEYILFYNSARNFEDRMPRFHGYNIRIVHSNYPNKVFNNIMQRLARWPQIDRLLNVDLFFMPNIGFISLSQKAKKIITIHDLSFLRFPEFYSFKRQLWHRIMAVPALLKRFDKIVAVSENTKADILELCEIDETRIEVIHSGVSEIYQPLAFSDPKFFAVKKKYKLPDEFILCLSTIEPRKNISGLIKAYNTLRQQNKDMSETKLVIAGNFGWRYKSIIKSWHASPYKDDIQFIGYVDTADKPYLYNLARLFVYSSFYEGFGFPPLEAMKCACPVIASSTGSLPELVSSAGIMVNPQNVTEISQAIEQILQDGKLAENLKVAGEQQAKKFSWQIAAEKYLELFRD